MIDLEELKNKKEALEIIGVEDEKIKEMLQGEFLDTKKNPIKKKVVNDKYVKIINAARNNRIARLLYTIMDNNLTTGWNPKRKRKAGTMWQVLIEEGYAERVTSSSGIFRYKLIRTDNFNIVGLLHNPLFRTDFLIEILENFISKKNNIPNKNYWEKPSPKW